MSKLNLLKYCRKADLQNLAEVLGIELDEQDNMAMIIKKIESADEYNEELTLVQAGYIVKDRKDQIVVEREKEDREKEKERVFMLEELKLMQRSEQGNSTPSSSSERSVKLPLKNIMHRFDPEGSEITLFQNLFERQANRSIIKADNFVTHLLALLPVEIAELILHEPTEKIDIFEHVKSLLLARYRLSVEVYQQKLNKHACNPGNSWRDLIFELNSFLEEWINGLTL